MELSEHPKFRLDLPGENHHDKPPRLADSAAIGHAEPIDEAESQMRKALGLLGEPNRHRQDADRSESRFNGGLHRRRFVQDGDVPVTVLRRGEPGHDTVPHRTVAPSVPPTTSRLQRTEAALAAETSAREKAERQLSDTQMIVRDLQTKIGHAELAKTEAVEALRRERESAVQLRADAEAQKIRLTELEEQVRAAEDASARYQEHLAEERQARKTAEKALRTAEAAREAAEQMVRTLSEETLEPLTEHHHPASAAKAAAEPYRHDSLKAEPPKRGRAVAEIGVAATTARRGRRPVETVAEPEPVKWWLNTGPGIKRR
jgi:hypothetical protein